MFRRGSSGRSLLERRLIGHVLLTDVEWRMKRPVVRHVYDQWAGASSSEQAATAYLAYSVALDREEARARIHGEVLEAVGKRLKTERHSRLVARGAAVPD